MPYSGFGPQPHMPGHPDQWSPTWPDLPNWAALADSSVQSIDRRKLHPALTPGLLLRLLQEEAHFKTDGPGSFNTIKGGHYGPAQFLPETGRGFGMPTRQDMENPHLAVPGAAHYLSQLANAKGGMAGGLAAYHGETSPDPKNPSSYVRAIMGNQGNATPVLDAKELGAPSGYLADIFSQLQKNSSEDLGEVQKAHGEAQQQQQAMLQQLMQQAGSQPEQVDPKQEWLSTLMGNLSQAMSPQMGGLEQATAGIDRKRQELKDIHSRRMGIMAQQYEELADRAHELGKTEDALKYGKKSQDLLEAIKADHDEQRVVAARTKANSPKGEAASVTTLKMKQAVETIKAELDVAVKRLNKTDSKGKGLKGTDLMQQRRKVAQLQLDYAAARDDGPPKNVLIEHVNDVIAQAKASNTPREKVLAKFEEARRNQKDETWPLGEYGIGIKEFTAALEAAWEPEPLHPSQGGDVTGPMLTSRTGKSAGPEVEAAAREVIKLRTRLAEVLKSTRAAGGNEALTMAGALRKRLMVASKRLDALGFTLNEAVQ